MRLAVALLIALFVGQALAYPAAAVLDVCTEACPDDRPDGTCEPTCADCTCCSHVAPPLVALVSALASPPPRSHAPAVAHRPAAPATDPRDVFHVPRLLA